MERVVIDIFGFFFRIKVGKIYILIVCDYFICWIEGFFLINIEVFIVV